MDHLKKPSWLKVKLPSHSAYFQVAEILKHRGLHTICQSARCPNIGECWERRTATFLILGNICTRNCGFCAVTKGQPLPLDEREPEAVLQAVQEMNLGYAVITSVTRDDLPDGGAGHFARTIELIKKNSAETRVEVLIPDFKGEERWLARILEAGPDVLNHNLETTLSLYPKINRPETGYFRSLRVLKTAARLGAITKSGLMVGLGESPDDLKRALVDLREAGCELLTMGQYLQPGPEQVPVARYYPPEEFSAWREFALKLGFRQVVAGPLVRSSYLAENLYQASRSSN
ncbi:MAG: lipoyl synthase [Candidatus Saccharicenans sp.]|nr:lipoyl synthase [Candidatus Saccharicenans sp.]MDH7493959.1 lipoyl synthase [Candidatus Saccharicenans sp.]